MAPAAPPSDYLLTLNAAGLTIPATGVYVRLVDNITLTEYITAARTDASGKFTPPAGIRQGKLYTTYTKLNLTDPSWTPTGDTAFPIPNIGQADASFPMAGPNPWYDITHPDYGSVIGGDCVAGINAVIAAMPAQGGTILVPGQFTAAAPLNTLALSRSVKFMGLGVGITNGATALSQITYSGSARFLNARGTTSFEWNGIAFIYTNAALTGVVFDAGDNGGGNDSYHTMVIGSLFTGSSTAVHGANPMWRLNRTNMTKFFNCNINNCTVAVRGRDTGTSDYSNIVEFDTVNFGQIGSEQVTASVANAGEAWYFHHCNFERLFSGAAGAYVTEAATGASVSLTFGEGCWFGDVLITAPAGTWIKAGPCAALLVTGARFGGGTTAQGWTNNHVAIEIAGGSADIRGNNFDTFNPCFNLTLMGASAFVDIGNNNYATIPFNAIISPVPGTGNGPFYRLVYNGQEYWSGPTMPVVTGINAGITSVTHQADDNDRRGTLTIVVGVGNVAAFTNLFTVGFFRTWFTTPRVFLQQADANQPAGFQPFSSGAGGFTVSNTSVQLNGSTTYKLQYECVG